MRRADYPQALMRAAVPALAAMEEDERRAPKRLQPLFAAARELIFEPDLDLERIQDAAGFADAEVWSDLREEVGQPAWSYFRDARLETAARLLLETEISVSEIGRLVGYGSPSTFRRPLRSFLGMPPSQYRRQARRLLERVGPPPDGADTNEYWERMLAGELSDDEARALDADLERLAPESAPEPATGEEDDRWTRLRRTVADGFAFTITTLPFADQRRLIRDAVWFPDETLFEHLSRLNREGEGDRAVDAHDPSGRRDARYPPGRPDGSPWPERGVELALLAVDSLAANQMLETHPGHAALAWARLALARWRAGDPAGAEQDLEQSAGDFERARAEDVDVASEAERSRVAAAFHWHQGRRRQALELADRSVQAHRVAGFEELPKALILRAELRAAIADLGIGSKSPSEDLATALEDVEEARELLAGSPEEQLQAVSLWLRIVVLVGDSTEMAAVLPQARRLAPDPLLRWFEGHCTAAAEPLWREARDRFSELGDELWAARATLDLARLCLAEGRVAEASALSRQLVSGLGALVASPEDLEALKALGRAAVPVAKVASGDLDRVESVLKRLEWNRRSRRALNLAT